MSPAAAAAAALSAARDVTLLAHVNPDADALGSALALGITLARRGVVVRVSFAEPEAVPAALAQLDVMGLVVSPSAVPGAPEVLVACDAAEPGRLGALAGRLATAGTTVMLDHHASNRGFGDVQVLDPAAEATAVLAHRVLVAMGADIDVDVARCLYAGLVTDTRNFRAAGPAAHRLAAELVATGLDPEALVRSLMDCHPHAWLAALGAALQRAELEAGFVHTTVPLADMQRFRAADVDSVVDVLRTVGEAEVAACLKQTAEQSWVVSLRSTGRVDVAAAAMRLGGGGHRGAAGFRAEGTEAQVLDALRGALGGGL